MLSNEQHLQYVFNLKRFSNIMLGGCLSCNKDLGYSCVASGDSYGSYQCSNPADKIHFSVYFMVVIMSLLYVM